MMSNRVNNTRWVALPGALTALLLVGCATTSMGAGLDDPLAPSDLPAAPPAPMAWPGGRPSVLTAPRATLLATPHASDTRAPAAPMGTEGAHGRNVVVVVETVYFHAPAAPATFIAGTGRSTQRGQPGQPARAAQPWRRAPQHPSVGAYRRTEASLPLVPVAPRSPRRERTTAQRSRRATATAATTGGAPRSPRATLSADSRTGSTQWPSGRRGPLLGDGTPMGELLAAAQRTVGRLAVSQDRAWLEHLFNMTNLGGHRVSGAAPAEYAAASWRQMKRARRTFAGRPEAGHLAYFQMADGVHAAVVESVTERGKIHCVGPVDGTATRFIFDPAGDPGRTLLGWAVP